MWALCIMYGLYVGTIYYTCIGYNICRHIYVWAIFLSRRLLNISTCIVNTSSFSSKPNSLCSF